VAARASHQAPVAACVLAVAVAMVISRRCGRSHSAWVTSSSCPSTATLPCLCRPLRRAAQEWAGRECDERAMVTVYVFRHGPVHCGHLPVRTVTLSVLRCEHLAVPVEDESWGALPACAHLLLRAVAAQLLWCVDRDSVDACPCMLPFALWSFHWMLTSSNAVFQ